MPNLASGRQGMTSAICGLAHRNVRKYLLRKYLLFVRFLKELTQGSTRATHP
jgi:hypothetical protein